LTGDFEANDDGEDFLGCLNFERPEGEDVISGDVDV
jgi:hypothetical protein